MIAGRAEAKFLNLVMDEKAHQLRFTYVVGDYFEDSVTVYLADLPRVVNHGKRGYWLQTGEKLIRLRDGPSRETECSVLEWFTTEKLIWDRSRERPGMLGFDHYRTATVYNLLYVGIAKVEDSFERLIRRGIRREWKFSRTNHSVFRERASPTRSTYLCSECSRGKSRATSPITSFRATTFFRQLIGRRIVADAEKAFVSVLQPS